MATSAPMRDDPHRLSRDQTAHSAQEIEQKWDDDWEPLPFTSAPPALEGFEQRWVRVRMGGTDDVQNFLKRTQQGWKPRPASTVPLAFQGLKKKLAEHFGDQGDVITNQDCVLMHRPTWVGGKIRARITEQNRRLSSSIREFVSGNMPRGRGTTGGAVEELKISRGRPVSFGDDAA